MFAKLDVARDELLDDQEVDGVNNEAGQLFGKYVAATEAIDPALELGDDLNLFECADALAGIDILRQHWPDLLEVLAARPSAYSAAFGSDAWRISKEERLAKLERILDD